MEDREWNNYRRQFVSEAKVNSFNTELINICLIYAKKLYDDKLPIIFDLEHFSQLVGYDIFYILGASNETARYYRHFQIKKKSGKMRDIDEPLPSLKEIQNWLYEEILSNVKISKAAKAYVKKQSIRDNARFHKGQKIVYTIDLKNFFGEISSKRVNYIFKKLGYSKALAKLFTELCCLDGSLPQGAPTSPVLSNIVFIPIDQRIWGYCKERKIRYTRYADDLTFSGDFEINHLHIFLKTVLRENHFKINNSKTRVMRRNAQQRVTGVVVNDKLQVPKKIRKKLRQEVYYLEKFGVEAHLSKIAEKRAYHIEHLMGVANHILHINPKDNSTKELLDKLRVIKIEYDAY